MPLKQSEFHVEFILLLSPRLRQSRDQERFSIKRQIIRLVDAIADVGISDIAAVGHKLQELEAQLNAINETGASQPAEIAQHPNASGLF